MLLLEQDIPEFVLSSPYLKSLLENGPFPEAGIEIPEGCAKKPSVLETELDLLQILWTLRFWLLPDCCDAPKCLFDYAFDPAHKEIMIRVCLEYGREFSFLSYISRIIGGTEEDYLKTAISCSCLSIIRYLCEEYNAVVSMDELMMAASVGRVECLEYLHNRGAPLYDRLAHGAAYWGRIDNLAYLHRNNIPMDAAVATIAATTGRVECLQYCLDSNGFSVFGASLSNILASAALGGMVGTLELLWSRFSGIATVDDEWFMVIHAVTKGHTNILQFAREHHFAAFHNPAGSAVLLSKVVSAGKVQCLEYLYSVGLSGTADDVARAVAKGHLSCLKYLLEHNCPFVINICYVSCNHNQLEVLKWAHTTGQPWHNNCCIAAACRGYLECLKFAHEHGCPWGEHVSECAACAPTTDCLRYVVEQGAQLTVQTARAAVECKSLTALQFLHSVHCPWDATICEEAAAAGSLECLRFLHENGCPWDQRTANAAAVNAAAGAPECLRYIQEQAGNFH